MSNKKVQCVQKAVEAAQSVVGKYKLFDSSETYLSEAIGLAQKWLENPTEENRIACGKYAKKHWDDAMIPIHGTPTPRSKIATNAFASACSALWACSCASMEHAYEETMKSAILYADSAKS